MEMMASLHLLGSCTAGNYSSFFLFTAVSRDHHCLRADLVVSAGYCNGPGQNFGPEAVVRVRLLLGMKLFRPIVPWTAPQLKKNICSHERSAKLECRDDGEIPQPTKIFFDILWMAFTKSGLWMAGLGTLSTGSGSGTAFWLPDPKI